MENFVVSARKYRPSTFNTVIGQASITTTLKNAIRNNHLAQAFLFCGPRGVGKTTCARILAKTVNCFNVTENTEPCNECESCKTFNDGQSFNIHELDAASNNSVDDIRALVEQVRFAPQLGKYKIYIIDEVHMLSVAAFNAFLKTLEEPPPYAKFILATTEKHKIIPTILSRCQIFDFSRIRIEDIADHLAYIAKTENIQADADALHIIAQKADGALRDACSIFDQIVTFAGNHLTYKAVIDNLNILDYDYYFKITDFILQKNTQQTLLTFNDIINKGFDGHNFIAGLSAHFRDLLVSRDPITIQLLEAGANIKEKYKTQAAACSPQFLINALNITNKCDVQYKSSKNPRLHIELALIQLCNPVGTSESAPKIAPPAPAAKMNDHATAAPLPTRNVPPIPVLNSPSTQSNSAQKPGDTPSLIIEPGVYEERKKAAIGKTLNLKGQPSISQFLQNKTAPSSASAIEPEPDKVATSAIKVSNFSEQELKTLWTTYAEKLNGVGKTSMFTTLMNYSPVLKEEFIIEFNIDNKVQEETLLQEKADLLEYLRNRLNNHKIDIRPVYSKVATEKKPYTTAEKFQRLAQINPALLKLKQQFDLDTEY